MEELIPRPKAPGRIRAPKGWRDQKAYFVADQEERLAGHARLEDRPLADSGRFLEAPTPGGSREWVDARHLNIPTPHVPNPRR